MIDRGKLVIVAILLLAVAAAAFAWWYRREQGQRILRLWGSEPAWLIRHAPQVELLKLSEAKRTGASPEAEVLSVDTVPRTVVSSRDISATRGMIHARQALIEDASFAWDQSRGDCQPEWRYALRFVDGNRQVTLAIDFDCQRVRMLEASQQEVSLSPIAAGLRRFINEQLQAETPAR